MQQGAKRATIPPKKAVIKEILFKIFIESFQLLVISVQTENFLSED